MKMTASSVLFAQMLRRLADSIEHMSEAEVREFLISLPPRKGTASRTTGDKVGDKSIDPEWMSELLSELQKAHTREDGIAILQQLGVPRSYLTEVAKAKSVHVTKQDNVQRIREKLVEAVIGSRLASRAIRGG